MPGLSPSVGGFRNDLIIRGGAPNETVFYLDEIETPNINHFSTQGSSGGPRGMINIAFIQDVTTSNSPAFGAEYDNPYGECFSLDKEQELNTLNSNFRFQNSESGISIDGPFFKQLTIKPTLFFQQEKATLQFLFKLIGLPIRPDYWDYQWKIDHRIDDYNSLSFIGLGAIDDFTVEAPDDFDANTASSIGTGPHNSTNSTTLGISGLENEEGNGKFILCR